MASWRFNYVVKAVQSGAALLHSGTNAAGERRGFAMESIRQAGLPARRGIRGSPPYAYEQG
jgi:hypothetical protein